MKETGLLFTGEMVRALLDGRKTMTRRLKFSGKVGDRIWVRETWAKTDQAGDHKIDAYVVYRATDPVWETMTGWKWQPSIFMPRWASRITLEVTAVKCERLNDITEEDARSEGIIDGGCLNCGNNEPCGCNNPKPDPRESFIYLWEQINGKRASWDSNPIVKVISFKRIEE